MSARRSSPVTVLCFSEYHGAGNLSFADILTVDCIPRLGHPGSGASALFEEVDPGADMDYQAVWNSKALSVNVSAPDTEPETWAMSLAGPGLVGGAIRRRHSRPNTAFRPITN